MEKIKICMAQYESLRGLSTMVAEREFIRFRCGQWATPAIEEIDGQIAEVKAWMNSVPSISPSAVVERAEEYGRMTAALGLRDCSLRDFLARFGVEVTA